MNSTCPSCEVILRNPKSCTCGWRLDADLPLIINTRKMPPQDYQHNREKCKAFVAFAHNLNKDTPYEPGAEE